MPLEVNGNVADKQTRERATKFSRIIMQKFVAMGSRAPSDMYIYSATDHIHRLFEGDIGPHHITAVRSSWLGYLPGYSPG